MTQDAVPRHGPPAATSTRLNWVRAGVLGANDGIVSVAGIVVGVAGATTASTAILTAGVAGWAAGAVSMALGEYVSVSSQRDTERALLDNERRQLAASPSASLAALTALYVGRGLTPETAKIVAGELTQHDALAAHAQSELRIDPGQLARPGEAAAASAVAFTAGAVLPLLAILLPPQAWRVPVTFFAVLAALAATGAISASLGGSPRRPAVLRVTAGGALAMAATYTIGLFVGAVV